ncbi:hypothetical protein [Actinophytocola sp.]|uniref:hypothetical protein n=1 Tax=Actinophytocola sp. TaxID=1872138 RepID=UPI002EDB0D07
MRIVRGLGLLLLVGLVLAACTVTRTGSPRPSFPADSSLSVVPTTVPTTTTSAPPAYDDTAADCADASCAIVVRGAVDVPLDAKFGFTDFVVTFVPPETVNFDGADPANGGAHGYLSGTGYMRLNGITITVDGYAEGGARLRFEPPA